MIKKEPEPCPVPLAEASAEAERGGLRLRGDGGARSVE